MAITIKDVARLADVSIAAVSLVINQKEGTRVSPQKKKKILDVIEKYNYVKNPAATSLAQKKTFRIGLCVYGNFKRYPVIQNPEMYEIISLISNRCHQMGYTIDLIKFDPKGTIVELARDLSQVYCDGIFLLRWEPSTLRQLSILLSEKSVKSVSIDSVSDEHMNWVSVDRPFELETAIEYLIKNGATSITEIETSPHWHADDRMFLMQKNYIKKYKKCKFNILNLQNLTLVQIKKEIKNYLKEHPEVDALILGDSYFAPAIMHLINRKNIQIICIGDSSFIPYCDPTPPYTQAPVEKIVDWSIERMLSLINHKEMTIDQELLTSELQLPD